MSTRTGCDRDAAPGDGHGHLGRVLQRYATVIIAAGLMITGGRAVAYDVPRPGPSDRYDVSVRNPGGELVFNIRGTPKLSTKGQFHSTGTVRFWPKLCAAAYRLQFRVTTIKGDVTPFVYPARLRRGRLDGVAKRCPFDGLPRRSFASMHVQATIDKKPLLTFDAQPFKRSHDPFAWLRVRNLKLVRPYTPAGLLRARIRVRYASHESHSHTVELTVDTDVPLPRR